MIYAVIILYGLFVFLFLAVLGIGKAVRDIEVRSEEVLKLLQEINDLQQKNLIQQDFDKFHTRGTN